jgi:hypothetical protein
MHRRAFLVLLPPWLLHAAVAGYATATTSGASPKSPNFSGTWRQSNERSSPARTGDVMLLIDHRDPELTIETSSTRGAAPPRHATQHYTTDGKASVSTGADGDEFHTSVTWKDQSLVFQIEEHEDGRILLSREVWSLIQNGSALERLRERRGEPSSKGGAQGQTIVYLRESTAP